MAGDVEFGKCDVCHEEKPLQRKYYHYDVKCECCSPKHFEFVSHCADCTPLAPIETKPTILTKNIPLEKESINHDLSNCVVGTLIWLEGEKQKYTVQVASERYLICTKPFNAQKTVLYTILDLKDLVRGTDNLVFSYGYESKEDCLENMVRLLNGEMEISRRNRVPLRIQKFDNGMKTK